MTPTRLRSITSGYPRLKIAVLGDFSLDRYLEIDPSLNERSIETGRTVHNVTHVRSQAGSAGTIVNNLSALGIGEILPIGFCGHDGEGFELTQALKRLPGVSLKWFVQSKHRRTFTYCKPLVIRPNRPPKELNRLDSKNWSPTPPSVEKRLIRHLESVAKTVHAIIVMDQVEVPESGVVTSGVLTAIKKLGRLTSKPPLLIGDSRTGLARFPAMHFKMNNVELDLMSGHASSQHLDTIKRRALALAKRTGKPVFITLAEKGILAADSRRGVFHGTALPVTGEIDIVGAGDAVTANLAAALTMGATLRESIIIANAAARSVVHELGTTGTADPAQIKAALLAT
jgi:rfaE bifunctional protein kinase chain/domain